VNRARQPSLFQSDGPIGPASLDEDVEHHDLGDGAWVDLRRSWMAGADRLFDRLDGIVPWQEEERVMYERMVAVPRLVATYGEDDALPDPSLEHARCALNARYGIGRGGPLRTVGICLYRDGRDSVAWHGDRIGRRRTDDTVVAIVSLGDTRRLRMRPRGGGISQHFDLGSGDLLVMGGTCQRTWEHSVPKTRRPCGPRISVQFRSAGPDDADRPDGQPRSAADGLR
jgi:alkylated DNA repair dioxygenase AlkB